MILYNGPQAIKNLKDEEMKSETCSISFPNCAVARSNTSLLSSSTPNVHNSTIDIPPNDFQEEHATNLYTEWNY
ncbi:MAG: hypothetical protein V4561_01260 [Bacteroidota bacterium]